MFFSLLFSNYSVSNGSHRGSDLSELSDFDIEELIKMHKLCRQVSIESPGPALKDCVFSFVVPVPDTPLTGARVKVRIFSNYANCIKEKHSQKQLKPQFGLQKEDVI